MTNINKLLSREEFRTSVLDRDNNLCIVCKEPAIDVHHIIDRKLFQNGGYYINNGVSLCEQHHIEAENTILSCTRIRELAEIKKIVLPSHLYTSQNYDKWGNPILLNGQRLKGDLFFEENVQKVLKEGNALSLFTPYVKYPRTYHLPWSPGITKDDKMIESTKIFENKEVIVSVKLDGEQTSMYNDHIHARSVDAPYNGEWRTWAKRVWSTISHDIPDGWRICCENLQGKHSIQYSNLESFINLISVWNEKNFCLSWGETEDWAKLFNLPTVPILYKGIWNESLIKSLNMKFFEKNECEGYVVRIAKEFYYSEFRNSCAKFVREDHVNSSRHWKYKKIVFNSLKNNHEE